jgi:hypothetical protein
MYIYIMYVCMYVCYVCEVYTGEDGYIWLTSIRRILAKSYQKEEYMSYKVICIHEYACIYICTCVYVFRAWTQT